MKNSILLRGIVTTGVVGLCFTGFNAAFLLGIASIPLALWAFAGVKRNMRDGTQQPRWSRLAAMACGAALLVGAPLSCSLQTHWLERAIEPTLEALERHRAETGVYPERLEDLVPARIPRVPDCSGVSSRRAMRLQYDRADDAGVPGFVVTCVTYAFNKHSYRSSTRQWVDWD